MSIKAALIILFALIALCSTMFILVISIKLAQSRKEKQRGVYLRKIRPILTSLYAADTINFFRNHMKGIAKLEWPLKNELSLQVLEELLLESIENEKAETKIRARTIADELGLPPRSLALIRSKLDGNIAIGCRKAGLYKYENAVPDIVKALEIFSSTTQLEVLMALSRIGNSEVLAEAFDKINQFILVNERAINEIVSVFTGDRHELYKLMLHNKSDYLVRIFLKAIDRETANSLIGDITNIYKSGDKETRLACIVAIGKSENSGKIPMLVRALRDTEWEIRAMAAKTLGVLTGPLAITALAKAARDREWWVRQNAVTSILSYPGREEILSSIIRTGDKYAYDSIVYTLEKANQMGLLAWIKDTGIKDVWSKEQKRSTIREKVVS